MTRYSTCLRILLAQLIVLAGVSVSEAGLFGRWRVYYDYPTCAPATVSAPRDAGTPAASQPAVSSAGPTVYTAMKPVIGPNAADAAPAVPQTRVYAPATGVAPSGSWSTTPRSSWDFGRFPPYSN